ncbi:zinc finger protein 64-like [Euwallacea fornicatus]|uniref:zinc finger protein 64-like n=1 Tax=Euwallacea fornicatus TaxID=995702 RepID=UPI00338E8BF2
MSHNANSTCESPVETYKCSQCNFYTNHEYYLEQHNLTHGLQNIIEQQKQNLQFNPPGQAFIKIQSQMENQMENHIMGEQLLKPFDCGECGFKTDHEQFYRQHLLSHNSHYNLAYASYKHVGDFNSYGKPEINSTTDLLNARIDPSGIELALKAHDSHNSFKSVLIKRQSVCEMFKCAVELCTYETSSVDDLKEHGLIHGTQSCSDVFRCLSCEFQTSEENEMKQHIKITHEKIDDGLKLIENVKEVFRCNNCDYETNLKAFLKRHMLVHTVKVEVKDELEEKYHCSQCSFETEHEKFLKRHEQSHEELKHFKCQKCNFQTLYKQIFLKHLKAHGNKIWKKNELRKSIKCKECPYKTLSKELLEVHRKIEHVKKDVKQSELSLFSCKYCKYQTNWEPCLKRHIDREHSDGKVVKVKKDKEEEVEVKEEEEREPPKPDLFRCHDCDFSSKSKQYLILHLKRSHIKIEQLERPKRTRGEKSKMKSEPKDTKLYNCKFRNCTFQTSIKSNYVHHLRKHQSQNPQRIMFHFCELCDFIAKTEENLEEHERRKHLNQSRPVYACNQCDFKTVFKYSLKTHSIKHKVYSCDVCEMEIESAYALVKHRKTHQINPKNRIYLCDVCGFQSKNDRSLKMHKKTHNPEFKCPDCPFQTHSKVNFQNHCINHKSADEVTMFPCPHCSYQSRLKRNLAWHMKRHADPSKAQIFKCPSCEYQTFTNAQLKSHLMVHKSKEEVIMLKCDFCTFETKRKSNMVQHRLRHLKDSPDVPLLSCPDCNYTTVAKRHLNKHRKTHDVNPDKMFQCTYCSYKIHRKIYLMRHMESHKTLETFGNDQWGGQRYTFPPQPHIPITGVTVVPNLGQNLQNHNLL